MNNNCHATEKKNNTFFFQPKLNIDSHNNPYEHEANTEDKITQHNNFNSRDFLKPTFLQCKHDDDKPVNRSFETENYVNNLQEGKPLNNREKTFFESRLGYDFSDVRIHTDSNADRSAKEINALAYTSNNNIVFASNEYQPGTTKGDKLLAHELTHVIQQNDNNMPSIQRKVEYAGEEIHEDKHPLEAGSKTLGFTDLFVGNIELSNNQKWNKQVLTDIIFPLPETTITESGIFRKKHCTITNKDIDITTKSVLHILQPEPWSLTIPKSQLKQHSKTAYCNGEGNTTLTMPGEGNKELREHVKNAEIQHANDNACLTERYFKSYEAEINALPGEIPLEEVTTEACTEWLENKLKRKDRLDAFTEEYSNFKQTYDGPAKSHLVELTLSIDPLDCNEIPVKINYKPLTEVNRNCDAWVPL